MTYNNLYDTLLQKRPDIQTIGAIKEYPPEITSVLEGIYQDLYEHGDYVTPCATPGKKSLLLVYGYDIPIDRFLSGLMKQDYEEASATASRFQALASRNGGAFQRGRVRESTSLIEGRRDKNVTTARQIGKRVAYIHYNTVAQLENGMLGFMGIPMYDFPLVYRTDHSTLMRNLYEKIGGDTCYNMRITEIENYMLDPAFLIKLGEKSWDRRSLEKHIEADGGMGRWRLLPSHFL